MQRARRAWRAWSEPQSAGVSEYYPLWVAPDQALATIDDLVLKRGIGVYRDMPEQDDMVMCCSSLLKFAVISAPSGVAAASRDPMDVRIADFVRDSLRYMPNYSLQRLLLDSLDAVDVGWVVLEKLMEPPRPAWKSWPHMQGLATCLQLAQETVRLDVDEHGMLRENGVWQAKTTDGMRIGEPGLPIASLYNQFPREKFIVWKFLGKWGHPYGRSMLRAAYPWYQAKKQAMQFWARHIETHGTPPIIGKVQKGTKTTVKEAVLADMRKIKYSGYGVIEDGTSVDVLKDSTSANADYYKFIQACDKGIAHALLNPSLLMDNTSTGSRALGETQQDAFVWTVNTLRGFLYDEVVDKQIVQWLVEYNFGEKYDCPKVYARETNPNRLKAMLDVVDMAIGWGVPVGVDYIRNVCGLDEPDEGEPLARPIMPIQTIQTDGQSPPKTVDSQGNPVETVRNRVSEYINGNGNGRANA